MNFPNRAAHKAEVRSENGITRLYIDGRPITPMTYQFMSSNPDLTNNIPLPPFMPTDEMLTAMNSAGVKLYFIRLEVRDPADFEVCFEKLSRQIRQLRRNVKDAYAIPWLIISPYADFYNKYPRDVQTFDDGSVGGYTSNCSGRINSPETPRHTHASLAWRHETAGVLRELVRRVQSEDDLNDTVVGYFFFPLHHESSYFYDFDSSLKLEDYSDPTRLAFRNYLAEKYRGDVSLLRAAWHDKTVTFESAALPNRAERERAMGAGFYDPSVSRKVIDYFEIRSRVWADTLEYFARACKQESGNRAIIGAFWGYLIHADTLLRGQSYFRQMMDSPHLDFWASPFTYVNKNPGMSVTVRFLVRSLQKHGKLVFAECDTTTSTSQKTQLDRQGMIIDAPWQDAEVFKREFTYALTEGMNGWWIDWPSGTAQYDENLLLPLFRRIQEVGRSSVGKNMKSVAEIAEVLHQESLFAVPFRHLTENAIEGGRIHETPYLGAPVDHFELWDVLDRDLPYKMYVFDNLWDLNEDERRAIHSLVATDGKTLVFKQASGLFGASENLAENVTELTGIRVKQVEPVTSAKIVLTENAKTLGLTEGDVIGTYEKLIRGGMAYHTKHNSAPYPIETYAPNPTFVIDDKDAVILGVYADNGLPAFAMKQVGGATVFYLGSTCLNTRVMRAIAKHAGVHLVTETDAVIYENQSYLGIHAAQGGEITLRLRAPSRLLEVFDKDAYEQCDQITLSLKKGDTRLFEKIKD